MTTTNSTCKDEHVKLQKMNAKDIITISTTRKIFSFETKTLRSIFKSFEDKLHTKKSNNKYQDVKKKFLLNWTG